MHVDLILVLVFRFILPDGFDDDGSCFYDGIDDNSDGIPDNSLQVYEIKML